MPVTLGEKIRSERTAAGLTLRELGERSKISVSYLNDIEHDRTVPTLGRLQSIGEALGTDAHALLAGVDRYNSSG
jgi:transcriptional regulator with XRE-family HTH domain